MKGPWIALTVLLSATAPAVGQPVASNVAPPTAPSQGTPRADKKPGEAEFLVAPGGGAFDVPVRIEEICILTFPDELTMSAIKSSEMFEVNAWNKDSVAVRALPKATTATLAIVTKSGAVKVNVTLRVVGRDVDAFTLVRFRAVSAEEALEARVAAEVAKRIAPMQAKLDEVAKKLEETIVTRSTRAVQDASLVRADTLSLGAHGRNDQHVVAHVERALLLGDDAFLFFEVENRSPAPYRLVRAQVLAGGVVVSQDPRLRAAAPDKDPAVLGVVRAGASVRGVVTLRGISKLRKKSLTLALADVGGKGAFEVTRGISLP